METLFPKTKKINLKKMETKKILVSFLLVLSLALLPFISAAPVASGALSVEVDGVDVGANPVLVSGDSVVVRVEFTSAVNISDVTVEVEIEGKENDAQAETLPFDVEEGNAYTKSLKLDVPFDLDDELSDFVTVEVTVSGQGFNTEASYQLRLQRASYNADILAVGVPQSVSAGDLFPVDVVLKNLGYNNLDDVFVTATIPALGIERTEFFGDLVALECDDEATAESNYGVDVNRKCDEDDEDTLSRRMFLQAPYSAQSGLYALEITVENDDTVSTRTVQVNLQNAFSAGNFLVSGSNLLIVNPTNDVIVYRLVPENTGTASVSVSENLVAVPAGSSKMVSTSATSSVSGTYTYRVNVFSSTGELVDTVEFTSAGTNTGSSSPIVVLTVILAIIFVVLLVVLIVLIGKKPSQTEEFGESYY